MKIRLDRADTIFSQVIRLRDRVCVRCKSPVIFNEKGLPISHQNSHFYGRGQEFTRYYLENCDSLCFACHIIWGSRDREDYREFKLRQLGKQGFDLLLLKSKILKRKDRKMELIKSKILLEELLKE